MGSSQDAKLLVKYPMLYSASKLASGLHEFNLNMINMSEASSQYFSLATASQRQFLATHHHFCATSLLHAALLLHKWRLLDNIEAVLRDLGYLPTGVLSMSLLLDLILNHVLWRRSTPCPWVVHGSCQEVLALTA